MIHKVLDAGIREFRAVLPRVPARVGQHNMGHTRYLCFSDILGCIHPNMNPHSMAPAIEPRGHETCIDQHISFAAMPCAIPALLARPARALPQPVFFRAPRGIRPRYHRLETPL